MYVKNAGVWKEVTTAFVKDSGAWKTINRRWVKEGGVWKEDGFGLNITISADVTAYNIKTAALAAGWNGTTRPRITITVNSGIYISGSSISGYAMDTGTGWPAGSVIVLINNGTIVGRGGNAGNGGYWTGGSSGGTKIAPTAGQVGGNALHVDSSVTMEITNNGIIGGGGNGGTGGVANSQSVNVNQETTTTYYGGGGGGGGRGGKTYSSGGTGGSPGGNNGGTGTELNPGAGGSAVSPGSPGAAGGELGVGGSYYLVGNAYVVWIANGLRYGSVS